MCVLFHLESLLNIKKSAYLSDSGSVEQALAASFVKSLKTTSVTNDFLRKTERFWARRLLTLQSRNANLIILIMPTQNHRSEKSFSNYRKSDLLVVVLPDIVSFRKFASSCKLSARKCTIKYLVNLKYLKELLNKLPHWLHEILRTKWMSWY